jgi:hypothetical protein
VLPHQGNLPLSKPFTTYHQDPRLRFTMHGDDPPERPEYVSNIINGLERYNPEASGALEAYLTEQCEQKYCDCNANRALLKL